MRLSKLTDCYDIENQNNYITAINSPLKPKAAVEGRWRRSSGVGGVAPNQNHLHRDALDRQLLVPFQYFGLHDNTDLDGVSWQGGSFGKYNQTDLQNLYTNDHARVDLVLTELEAKLASVHDMKALGFCVGIDHAIFMARIFNERGVPSIALTSQSSRKERSTARN